ncbi:MAG: universal stress protein [Proteobacteria bacterium]|nr:universal stress protein [Pseudomonadota bacterium]
MSNKNDVDTQVPTILVCLDTTIASNIVLRYACYKAKRTGFAVEILAVIESSYKSLLFVSKVIGKNERAKIEKHLNRLITEVQEETGITPSVSIREGDITTEIINGIRETQNCTMLILGKSHNSLSDNTVLPKLSGQIGNKINVPITIVPEDLSDKYLKELV